MHAMATHFGGVGDTLVENPKTQDIDNVSEDESQDEDLIRQFTLQDSRSQTVCRR